MIFDISRAWVLLPGFIIGLTVHEYAHALTAYLLGDRYAQTMGRLTLNPLAHLSPLGLILISLIGFGWARPVPVNAYNFRHPRRDFLVTALAGPLSNIVLMFAFIGIYRALPPEWETLSRIVMLAADSNAVLAVLNLMPVYPLDGSRILNYFLPQLKLDELRYSWMWSVLLIFSIRMHALDDLFDLIFSVTARLAG